MSSFKIARRNILRNKRRTLITAASIFFAVFFALMMRSMQLGTYSEMIKNVASSYIGHIQIHKKGYQEDKTINNIFTENTKLETTVAEMPVVQNVVPLLESFALASFKNQTKGSIIIGTDPEKENKMTKLADKLISGSYFSNANPGVLISEKLASFLKTAVGDTVVLMGQGYHAVTAAGKYPVRGIIHLNSPNLNNKVIYLNLRETQSLYSAPNMLSSVSVLLKNTDDIKTAKKTISDKINSGEFEVIAWDEALPELKQAIESDNVGGQFMLAILYMIVGFGVFGTIVMMTVERKKEFGIMTAVGMKKIKLAAVLFYETLLLGVFGILSGFAVSLPLILYFSKSPIPITGDVGSTFKSFGFEPVVAFSTNPHFMINQILVVVVIVLVAYVYPFSYILKINPVKALRN